MHNLVCDFCSSDQRFAHEFVYSSHPASFRFHLTVDTLTFGYILPTTGRIGDLHPLETCAARRTLKKGASVFQPMLLTFFFLHNKLYFYPSSSTIRTQPQTPVRPLHPPQSLPLPLVLNPLHLYLAKAQPRATKPGRTTLCGRLEQALRSDAYVGFREGQLTLVNHSRS